MEIDIATADIKEVLNEDEKKIITGLLEVKIKKEHDHDTCSGCKGICCTKKKELKKENDETHTA